jgi:hypothetical protein
VLIGFDDFGQDNFGDGYRIAARRAGHHFRRL